MSHYFLKNGRYTYCGDKRNTMVRGEDGKLPVCPDTPAGKYSILSKYSCLVMY